jgi:hypothetical protein
MRHVASSVLFLFVLTALVLVLTGCAAVGVAPGAARAGDTVAVLLPWDASPAREDMTVTITPSKGQSVTLPPLDPHVRGVVNLYPDPVSRLVVGTETDQTLGHEANSYGAAITAQLTDGDREWRQPVLYLDLPGDIPPGPARIVVSGPAGATMAGPVAIEILPGAGQPSGLGSSGTRSPETASILALLERADHATVTFAGARVPHSIQVKLSHAAGVGRPWVVNPRGDVKNLSWADDGSTLTVLLSPVTDRPLVHLRDFKFYVSGGVADLRIVQVIAYDPAGQPLPDVTGVVR